MLVSSCLLAVFSSSLYQQLFEKTAVYARGNYFFIPYGSNKVDQYAGQFNVVEEKNFGALNVFYLIAKPQAVTAVQQDLASGELSLQSVEVAKIGTWKKLLML